MGRKRERERARARGRERDHFLRVDSAMEKEGFAENVGELAFAQVLEHEVV